MNHRELISRHQYLVGEEHCCEEVPHHDKVYQQIKLRTYGSVLLLWLEVSLVNMSKI